MSTSRETLKPASGIRRSRAWDVYDRGKLCGRFYLDMHPREGKDKWFSAAPLIPGIAGRQLPEAALICNFPGGTARMIRG